MSVLIKGIKFDGHCWSCPCLDGEYGDCNALGKEANHTGEPLPDCPLIELPDHRDLIDRDTLKYELSFLYDAIGARAYGFVLGTVDGLPAVIPAERKGEEE